MGEVDTLDNVNLHFLTNYNICQEKMNCTSIITTLAALTSGPTLLSLSNKKSLSVSDRTLVRIVENLGDKKIK
jgi:hypothetical protein